MIILNLVFILPNISFADIDLGVSNKSLQLLGKSKSDGTQGHLTSYLSPNINLAIISNLKPKLKLIFSGEVTKGNFKAPDNHTLLNGSKSFAQYSSGFIYQANEKFSFKFMLGLEDSLFYYSASPTSILLDKSNDFFLKSSLTYLTENTFISHYLSSCQFSLKALSPLKNDFDKGSFSYGGELLLEKEFKREDFLYALQSFLGYQQSLMKNMTFTKEEIGFRFMIKIPIKSKKLL